MTTNIFSETAAPATAPTEPRGIIAALVTTLILALRRHLKRKAAARADAMTKGELLTATLALKDHMHEDHLSLLEKLDANHRELLAALDRLATRVNALEAGLARVDERTRK